MYLMKLNFKYAVILTSALVCSLIQSSFGAELTKFVLNFEELRKCPLDTITEVVPVERAAASSNLICVGESEEAIKEISFNEVGQVDVVRELSSNSSLLKQAYSNYYNNLEEQERRELPDPEKIAVFAATFENDKLETIRGYSVSLGENSWRAKFVLEMNSDEEVRVIKIEFAKKGRMNCAKAYVVSGISSEECSATAFFPAKTSDERLGNRNHRTRFSINTFVNEAGDQSIRIEQRPSQAGHVTLNLYLNSNIIQSEVLANEELAYKALNDEKSDEYKAIHSKSKLWQMYENCSLMPFMGDMFRYSEKCKER